MHNLPPIIQATERQGRVQHLRQAMAANGTDAVIVTPGSNMRYFFGLGWGETERFVAALVTSASTIFVCPKFEDTALLGHLTGDYEYAYWEEDEDPYGLAASILRDTGIQTCALDPNCSFGQANELGRAIAPIPLQSTAALITPLRAQKSPQELALMQAAKTLTLSVHKQVFEWLKPGIKASEVKQKINQLHQEGGADNGNTFCAVQFGEATAHPHGVPGDQVLQSDDLILIDTGCQVDGYNSDITRTYALSKQDSAVERLWALEKEAQAVAFDAAQLGKPCESVDTAAREALQAQGLGPDYKLPGLPHRTGHGIGLDIHEAPYLVRGDGTALAPGMCFSNEPMIVVPDAFGIRLEDHFYMTDQGPRWFTEPQNSLYEPFL
jgi:Xaa-Pro dipeptidase